MARSIEVSWDTGQAAFSDGASVLCFELKDGEWRWYGEPTEADKAQVAAALAPFAKLSKPKPKRRKHQPKG